MTNSMLALFVPPSQREQVLSFLPNSLKRYAVEPESLHVTLWYYGEATFDPEWVVKAVARWEELYLPLDAKIQGYGVFEKEDERVLYLSVDSTKLPGLYNEVATSVGMGSVAHGFTAHITLAIFPKDVVVPDLQIEPFEVKFEHIYLAQDELVLSNGIVAGVREKALDESTFELAKSVRDLPNGDLEIIVKGVPFGGPDYMGNRDYDGEYFDKSTDIGPLEKTLSYFHHGKDPIFGKALLGVAERMPMDEEEGWFYKIIVDKAAKYKRAIKALAEQGWLGGSSTPFQRTAEKNADGHWDRWHVVEVCLTYSPNNPTADVISVIEKSISIGEPMSNPKIVPVVIPDAVTPVVTTPVVEVFPDAVPTLIEQIEKAFEAPVEEVVVVAPVADNEARFVALEAKIDSLLGTLQKSVDEITMALPLLATKMAGNLRVAAAAELQKSAPEREVEQTLRQRTPSRIDKNLPADAPGNY